MAEQLEAPVEILEGTYSNSTWQNGTLGAARAVAHAAPGSLDRLGMQLHPVRLPDRGDDERRPHPEGRPPVHREPRPRAVHLQLRAVAPERGAVPGWRSEPLVQAPAVPDRPADSRRHPAALAGPGALRELLDSERRPGPGDAAAAGPLGLLLRRGRAEDRDAGASAHEAPWAARRAPIGHAVLLQPPRSVPVEGRAAVLAAAWYLVHASWR